MLHRQRLLSLFPVLALGFLPTGDVAWQRSWDEARKLASTEQRVLFVAVNMDGERANDRLAKKVYSDRTIIALSERTVNLVASNDTHVPEGRTCPRFGTLECREHRFVDAAVREHVLDRDERGFVVAPQHVFLAPDGEVILSVPYEISALELEWCFVEALRSVDPKIELEHAEDARAPRRLVRGGVWEVGSGEAVPITREQALELVAEHKKGMRGEEARRALRRIATADEPEAREYVLTVLRTAPGPRGGPAGGAGRRGAGGGRNSEQNDRRPQLLGWIGFASPPSYWEVCAEVLTGGEDHLRPDAVVALEQLAAPESLKVLLKEFRREKDPAVAKNLLRAIGAAGRDDKNARKLLMKEARDDREPLTQVNAIIGLASLERHDDVDLLLGETLAEGEGDVRLAAAVAMGLTRDRAWIETLETALAAEPDAELQAALEASIAVLEGGEIGLLEEPLTSVATDTITRRRTFGSTRGRD